MRAIARVSAAASEERRIVSAAGVPRVGGGADAVLGRKKTVFVLCERRRPDVLLWTFAPRVVAARIAHAAADEFGRVTLANEEIPAARAREVEELDGIGHGGGVSYLRDGSGGHLRTRPRRRESDAMTGVR